MRGERAILAVYAMASATSLLSLSVALASRGRPTPGVSPYIVQPIALILAVLGGVIAARIALSVVRPARLCVVASVLDAQDSGDVSAAKSYLRAEVERMDRKLTRELVCRLDVAASSL